uniref:Uncharacterized protein n=1 Tax=uncultured prokaryote TaxID=198431 RepID=A0A0H5Q4J2_9ZZZZ|nr:hypothetical protein [uncultured prokaryote]
MSGVSVFHLFIILFLAIIFILPSILAVCKHHPYKVPIVLVNLLGGLFFGAGWLIALIWCFILPKTVPVGGVAAADEIGKLHDLMEKGIISTVEFERRKSELLK